MEWIALVGFEVDVGCAGATTTKHYRASANGVGDTISSLG
jgi:hypothetical protein